MHWEVAKAPSTLLLSLLSHLRGNLDGEHCIVYCHTIITGFHHLCGEDAHSCRPHAGLGQTLHFIWRFSFLKVSDPKKEHTL